MDWKDLTYRELIAVADNVRKENWDHSAWVCYQIANRLDPKGLDFFEYHPYRDKPARAVKHNPAMIGRAIQRRKEKGKPL